MRIRKKMTLYMVFLLRVRSHNPEVGGSNPPPATSTSYNI